MVYTRSPDHLYRRNGIYYFASNVPSDLKTRLNKNRVVVSLPTRSAVKAQKLALALCDRSDQYFEYLRSERFDSQELGSKFKGVIDASSIEVHPSVSDGFEIHITLKDVGHDCLFAKTPSFNPGDLMVLVGDVHLLSIQPDNAGQLGDQVMTKVKHQTIMHPSQFLKEGSFDQVSIAYRKD